MDITATSSSLANHQTTPPYSPLYSTTLHHSTLLYSTPYPTSISHRMTDNIVPIYLYIFIYVLCCPALPTSLVWLGLAWLGWVGLGWAQSRVRRNVLYIYIYLLFNFPTLPYISHLIHLEYFHADPCPCI